jgi:hypothetical protein
VNGGHLSVIRLKDLELRGAGMTVFRATPVDARLGPRRPFVVMNPRSGGGKVARLDLQQRAEALGADVMLLDRPGTDVQELARAALAGVRTCSVWPAATTPRRWWRIAGGTGWRSPVTCRRRRRVTGG